ncbi:MAG: ABC transporter ATP-binding protein [Christensenellales bacterium]
MKQHRSLLSSLLKGQRLSLAVMLLCMVFISLLAFFPQQIIRYTVDVVLAGGPSFLPVFLENMIRALGGNTVLGCLAVSALAMVAVALINSLFTYLRSKLSADVAENIAYSLRTKLYDHIQRLPYARLLSFGTGDLLQRCTSDVETVRKFVSVQIMEMLRALCLVVCAIFIMWPMSHTMTLISLSTVPLLLFFSYFYFVLAKKNFLHAEQAESDMSVALQENLTGVRVVRAFAAQRQEEAKFDAASARFRDLSQKLTYIMSYYWSLSDLMIYAQVILTVCLGTKFALSGTLTIGTVITFSSYVTVLLWPVRQMGRILADLGKTSVALNRIQDILSTPIEEDLPQESTPDISGNIVFDHVNFSYQDGKPVLQDISFSVSAGQTVAILGATGSGKTTLMLLLQRLYDPTGGRILFDDTPSVNIRRAYLRQHVGIVLQEPFLYSRSVFDNIAITQPHSAAADVQAVSKMASLHDSVLSFEQGYQTMVGERGVTLSGGQKQRVAIARMLLQRTPVMIFDDSLSALDSETDAAIRAALSQRREKATTFIISHRVNSVFQADQIIVLDHGRIIESGTHQSLLEKGGLYAKLWRLQGAVEEEA